MSETTFSPGPWGVCQHMKGKAEDEACPCGYRGGIWDSTGELQICELGTTVIKGEEGLEPPIPDRATTRANARLIAAAPELFEALDCLLGGKKYEGEMYSDRIKRATDALAKAGGFAALAPRAA